MMDKGQSSARVKLFDVTRKVTDKGTKDEDEPPPGDDRPPF